MHRKGNYGVDSPGIVVALLALEKELRFRLRSWQVNVGGRAPSTTILYLGRRSSLKLSGKGLRQDPAEMPCMSTGVDHRPRTPPQAGARSASCCRVVMRSGAAL